MTTDDRGRRIYDWWGDHASLYRVVDALSRSLRERAVEELALGSGDFAVDLGCGPGASLGLLDGAVGPDGHVLGFDYSEAMVQRASERAKFLPATDLLRGDAAAIPVEADAIDGAMASLALSAMPDAEGAAAEIRRVLRPGGRFAVVDGRLPDGIATRVLSPVYERVANWQGHDPLSVLRETFPTVEVVETFDAGLGFVAVAEPR